MNRSEGRAMFSKSMGVTSVAVAGVCLTMMRSECHGAGKACGPAVLQDAGAFHAGSFASAMAGDGDTLIITSKNSWSPELGSAEVRRFDGSGWQLEAELSPPDLEPF